MKKLLRKILLELEQKSIPNPVYGEPNSNTISSRYGDSRGDRKHRGIDIPVNCGTPLMAPANGRVIEAGIKDDGCGGRITIVHNEGFATRYCHLQKIEVSLGEKVFKGEKIGEVGGAKGAKGAGTSTSGCHLHMELQYPIKNNVNPSDYVNLNLSPENNSNEIITNKGDHIKKLKCFLKHGLDNNNIDTTTDTIGSEATNAIKNLQNEFNLPQTGKVTANMIPKIKDKIQSLSQDKKDSIKACYSSN
jgi:hypothetical protein